MTMKFSILSTLALASAAPPAVESWLMGPMYYPVGVGGDPIVRPVPSMFAKQQALIDRMLRQTDELFQQSVQEFSSLASSASLDYDLVDDDTKFQLSVDVPGMNKKDIDISLDDDFLTVRDQRVIKETDDDKNSEIISEFSQSFLIGPEVEVDKISATLNNNGVLVVTAPKDMKRLEHADRVRKIPITMADASSSTTTKQGEVANAPSLLSATASDEKDTIDLDNEEDVISKKKDYVKNKVNVEVKTNKRVVEDANKEK